MKTKTQQSSYPDITRLLLYSLLFAVMASFISGCASARVTTFESKMGQQRATEPILLLPPIAKEPRLGDTCESLGSYLIIEIPKRVSGQVIDATNVQSLENSLGWDNLIVNGAINCQEVATMAKSLNCKSAITCQVMEVKPYPPFRMVVNLLWIDTKTGHIISKLYNDVDVTDSDTSYRFSCFVGEGPGQKLYERVFYSEALYHTAYISPEQFLHFVAAYSAKVLLSDKDSSFWTFWRIF